MTSWTLSGFADEIDDDPRVQFAVLRALGANHIEVRSAWGVNALDWTDEQLATFATQAREHGLAFSALASPIGKSRIDEDPHREIARLRRAIEIAQALDTGFIRIFSFYPADGAADAASGSAADPHAAMRDEVFARLSVFADEARRAGIVLVHENEKGIYGDVPERVLDIVESVGSENLRLAWDSANFVQVGVRPFTDGYSLLREHIAYLQVKDARFDTGAVVPAGEGDGELLTTLTALRDDGFRGFASLEPHLPADPPGSSYGGPGAFGRAARAFRGLTDRVGVALV